MRKRCIRCNKIRVNFYKNKTKKDGYDDHCKGCRNKVGSSYRVAYYKAHRSEIIARYHETKERTRDQRTVYALNRNGCSISLEEYVTLRKGHDGLCDVCRKPSVARHLALDHVHTTGKFRGFLCMSCNTGLGHFRDSIDLLQSAIQYLSR